MWIATPYYIKWAKDDVDSIQPRAEFGPNDHRDGALLLVFEINTVWVVDYDPQWHYDTSSFIQFHQWIKHFGQFSEGCLYIAVKAQERHMDGFSGKYYFHSLHKNIGVYIREPGTELFESRYVVLTWTL